MYKDKEILYVLISWYILFLISIIVDYYWNANVLRSIKRIILDLPLTSDNLYSDRLKANGREGQNGEINQF